MARSAEDGNGGRPKSETTSNEASASTPKDGDPQAAENPKTKKKPAKPTKSATAILAEQVEALRQSMEAQQQQIRQLQDELAKRDAQIGDAKSAAAAADAKASDANAKVAEVATSTAEVKTTTTTLSSDVADLKLGSDSLKGAVQDTQKKIIAAESPSTIHYKGMTLTPGGFLEAATVYRNRAASADINTPFTGIPYPSNSLSRVSENNFTARQSRLSLLAEGKLGSAKIGGYYEADFLSAGVTSNNRQSNSYTWRTRQAWGQVSWENGWSLTGGQMWSLATENRKGITNRQEVPPAVIDSQYNVGFTWARQYGFRIVKNFHDKFALAASVEEPQTTIGGRGFSAVSNTSATGAVSTSQNFWVDAPGAGGGLYNFVDTTGYTTNKAPDFIVKAAWDPRWGHYEVLGIVSEFRSRIYPCAVVGTNANNLPTPATPVTVNCGPDPTNTNPKPSSLDAFNDSRTGGGAGASAKVPLFAKKLDVSAKFVAGSGIGRYGSAQLPDSTARPDGTLALIKSAQWLGQLEFHANPKLDIYAYAGQEYGGRAAYQGYTSIAITNTPAIPATPTSGAIPATSNTTIKLNQFGGYGSPFANNSGCSTENPPSTQLVPSGGGTCAGDIRAITEGTIGFWHKIYTGPKGGVRWGIQYSYITKTGWSGNNNNAKDSAGNLLPAIGPKAVNNMLFTSFRYYIP
jgi:hypothetical protein